MIVERSADGATWIEIARRDPDAREHSDRDISPLPLLFYRVRAVLEPEGGIATGDTIGVEIGPDHLEATRFPPDGAEGPGIDWDTGFTVPALEPGRLGYRDRAERIRDLRAR